MLSVATGVGFSVASAILGAWIYARWQRRRQQPIARLRRTQALRMTYALLGGSSVVVWRMLNRVPAQAKRKFR